MLKCNMLPIIFVYKNREMNEQTVADFAAENAIPRECLFHLIPEKRQLSIEQIRLLKKQMITTSSQRRLFVLHDFDMASPPAQNALLKTLEEKRDTDYFLLLVNQLERVLSTIRSRCHVRFADDHNSFAISEEMKKMADSLSQQKTLPLLSHPHLIGMTQEKALQFLDELIIALRTQLSKVPDKTVILLKDALKTKSLLQSNNLNPQLAIDSLLLKTLDNKKKETR